MAPRFGRIGLSACPGRKQLDAASGRWYRDLGIDLNGVANWGTALVVTVADHNELLDLDVADLGAEVRARHMAWIHLPLKPGRTTSWRLELNWAKSGPVIRALIRQGFPVLIHSRAGTHRATLIAARLLIELGVPPQEAVRRVNAARPNAPLTQRMCADLATRSYCPEPWPSQDAAALADRAFGALLGLMVGEAQAHAAGAPSPSPPEYRLQPHSATMQMLTRATALLHAPDFDRAAQLALPMRHVRASPAATAQNAPDQCLLGLGPLAIFYHRDRPKLRAAIAHQSDSAQLTPDARDACLALAEMLADAIEGRPATTIFLRPNFSGSETMTALMAGRWRGARRADLHPNGLAINSLEAALWATCRSPHFDQAVTTALALQSTSPTLAALTGQLSGALLGARAIPAPWRRAMPFYAKLRALTDGLLRLA